MNLFARQKQRHRCRESILQFLRDKAIFLFHDKDVEEISKETEPIDNIQIDTERDLS